MKTRRRKQRARPRRIPRVRPGDVLRGVALLGLLATISYGVMVLMDQPLREVTLEAPLQRVSALQIEAAVQSRLSGGFLSVDLGALREAVAALPWVDRVRVRRIWPAGLEVTVTEQVAAARWGDSGLLNTRGELFMSEARHVPAELPRLHGPEGSEWQVAQRYLDYRNKLLPAGLTLTGLDLDDRGAWRVWLSHGLEIRLGREASDARMQRFVDTVTPLLAAQTGRIAYVDMRYTNGFAVGWRPDAEPPAGETASDAS